MKAKQLIEHLRKLIDKHGNVPVAIVYDDGCDSALRKDQLLYTETLNAILILADR